eukprot:11637327-Alexandrium_andersonii.AAC.1
MLQVWRRPGQLVAGQLRGCHRVAQSWRGLQVAPSPRMPHADPRPSKIGSAAPPAHHSSPLAKMVRLHLANLDEKGYLPQVRRGLCKILAGDELSIGTLCSGSEMPVSAVEVLLGQ